MGKRLETLRMEDYFNDKCKWCKKIMTVESDFRNCVVLGSDYLITCKEGHIVFDSNQ